MNKCLQCGKETKNPKFCNRSCAAKYNNKAYPKRHPENFCSSCGTPIATRYNYCELCREKAEIIEKKMNDSIYSWMSLDGRVVEKKISKVYYMRKTVFKKSFCNLGNNITYSSKIEVLVNHLIDILFSNPPFVRESEVFRYASLLYDFMFFEICNDLNKRKNKLQIKVKDFHLSDLVYCINSWIRSIQSDSSAHPLILTYAIDTCLFICKMLSGYHFDRRVRGCQAEVESIMECNDLNKLNFNILFDSNFKKNVTEQNIRYLLVVAKLPIGCKITNYEGEILCSENDEILFRIKRCHLSSGVYDNVFFSCHDYPEIEYDISEDFNFYGELIFINKDHSQSIVANNLAHEIIHAPIYSNKNIIDLMLYIPIRWISHVQVRDEDPWNIKFERVPEWECKL